MTNNAYDLMTISSQFSAFQTHDFRPLRYVVPNLASYMALHADSRILSSAVSTKTIRTYLKAALLFCNFCLQVGVVPRTIQHLDIIIAHYFDTLHRLHRGPSSASLLLAALAYLFPPLHLAPLRIASLSLRGWRKMVPTQSHTPCPEKLVVVMALAFAKKSRFDLAVAALLCFHGLLRVNECLSLRKSDLWRRPNGSYLLWLRCTKTGPDQSVTISDPQVTRILDVHLDLLRRPSVLLFDFSANYFRSCMASLCDLYQLPNFVPHSFRHGRAVELWLTGISLQDVAFAGRWKSLSSVKVYLQLGRHAMNLLRIPHDLSALFAIARPHLALAIMYAYLGTLP